MSIKVSNDNGVSVVSGTMSGLTFNQDEIIDSWAKFVKIEKKYQHSVRLLGDSKQNLKRDFGSNIGSAKGSFKHFLTHGELPVVDGLSESCLIALMSDDIELVKDMLISTMYQASKNERAVSPGYCVVHKDDLKHQ